MPPIKIEFSLRGVTAFMIFAIGTILILLTLLPGIIYFAGLFNVDGRPATAQECRLNSAEKLGIWRAKGESAVDENDISVRAMNPWSVAWDLARNTYFGDTLKRSVGERAAWFVARNHNMTHLGNRRMAWWHVSGAALTIWLTRHWTAEELICKANEIKPQLGK